MNMISLSFIGSIFALGGAVLLIVSWAFRRRWAARTLKATAVGKDVATPIASLLLSKGVIGTGVVLSILGAGGDVAIYKLVVPSHFTADVAKHPKIILVFLKGFSKRLLHREWKQERRVCTRLTSRARTLIQSG